jgi:chemotaxis response regulator CheB
MRIALVNDLPLAVETVRRVLRSSPEHELAWVAYDGVEAVARCAGDTPDLILMDLLMPNMDGVEATRRIMAQTPCAILVVTADVCDNSSKVFEAMGAGALDAVNTPVLEFPDATKSARALLSKIDTIARLLGDGIAARVPPQQSAEPATNGQAPDCLIAIGASAGGPAALATLLAALPSTFPAPLVIVQHVDAQFAQGLATWLDHHTPLQVLLAQEGMQPHAGSVFLAGGDNHLVLNQDGRLAYTRYPLNCGYRPSIDTFFESIDRFWPGDVIALLLTGMGRDGAAGLRTLRSHGYHTIAQDQATSAVYGMPKAAADMSAASEILPLEKIGPRLAVLAGHKQRVYA